MKRLLYFLIVPFTFADKCQRCGIWNARPYRQDTMYENEYQNWVTLCPDCRKENDEHWKERWREYHSGCL